MKTVLILDTETTGLAPESDRVIEVAAVRYSLAHRCVLESYASLIRGDGNAAENVNHIPAAALAGGEAPHIAWQTVECMGARSDAVLAHNADFDRSFTPREVLANIPWIDTCGAVDWPRQSKPGASLISLCLDHGLGVVDPHRALSDCLMLARLLARVAETHDVNAILARGLRPRAMFQALVSYDDRALASDAGFRWKPETKQWLRRMAVEDAAQLGFRTKEIANG